MNDKKTLIDTLRKDQGHNKEKNCPVIKFIDITDFNWQKILECRLTTFLEFIDVPEIETRITSKSIKEIGKEGFKTYPQIMISQYGVISITRNIDSMVCSRLHVALNIKNTSLLKRSNKYLENSSM